MVSRAAHKNTVLCRSSGSQENGCLGRAPRSGSLLAVFILSSWSGFGCANSLLVKCQRAADKICQRKPSQRQPGLLRLTARFPPALGDWPLLTEYLVDKIDYPETLRVPPEIKYPVYFKLAKILLLLKPEPFRTCAPGLASGSHEVFRNCNISQFSKR
jgi:hypothetical protein